MAVNYPVNDDVDGAMIYDILNHGIFDGGSYPFALIMKLVVRRVLRPNFKTWNTPSCISNVNSDLGNPAKNFTYSAIFFVINGWKYADFGALTAGSDMTTQAPLPSHIRRILLSFLLNKLVY